MRVWDIEPTNFCHNHLLGEHREIHAIWSILTSEKRGYRRHPETQRWVGKLAALKKRHDLVVSEMVRRGYNHFSDLDEKLATGNINQDVYIDSPDRQTQILNEKNCPCVINQ